MRMKGIQQCKCSGVINLNYIPVRCLYYCYHYHADNHVSVTVCKINSTFHHEPWTPSKSRSQDQEQEQRTSTGKRRGGPRGAHGQHSSHDVPGFAEIQFGEFGRKSFSWLRLSIHISQVNVVLVRNNAGDATVWYIKSVGWGACSALSMQRMTRIKGRMNIRCINWW